MCLILLAYGVHPRYPFVLAANRDEFYERPAACADFWEENPDVLAGRDLKEGGTWCGVTRGGRIAALTNYRDPLSHREGAPSRGWLVRRFLEGIESPRDYLGLLEREGPRYNGFSIIFGTVEDLYHYSNRGVGGRLTEGFHGLSNSLLDVPWPKVARGREALASYLAAAERPEVEALFRILADRTPAGDEELPNTGVGREWERILSPIFITSPVYGTRSSTVIMIDGEGRAVFTERSYNGGSEAWQTAVFRLRFR
ncbi:MAG TPA: NRDE family protein [Syntrophales bacterium]|nr:NRDE family protein [Syntrophales bacterium]HOM08052.1 NRDE family protein [Syntrophales bacterium]HON99824.1 NRDE family protein [Syntrophales bacterium]HPC01459.1 NRDE family protein [Syntrophales bacterium]HPQ07477.1 NRDE family protein [Syntrophales bacterium]